MQGQICKYFKNYTINNNNCTYNSETQCWECSYLANKQSYDIILNNTIIG